MLRTARSSHRSRDSSQARARGRRPWPYAAAPPHFPVSAPAHPPLPASSRRPGPCNPALTVAALRRRGAPVWASAADSPSSPLPSAPDSGPGGSGSNPGQVSACTARRGLPPPVTAPPPPPLSLSCLPCLPDPEVAPSPLRVASFVVAGPLREGCLRGRPPSGIRLLRPWRKSHQSSSTEVAACIVRGGEQRGSSLYDKHDFKCFSIRRRARRTAYTTQLRENP